MRCMTAATDQISSSLSALELLVTLWVSITRTVMLPSMTPWSGSFKSGTCATHWFGVRETLVDLVTTPQLLRVTPSARWHHLPWRWCATSMKRLSTSKTTTTEEHKSQPFFLRAFQIFWSTDQLELQLVWRPTSRHTTSKKLQKLPSLFWKTQIRAARNF